MFTGAGASRAIGYPVTAGLLPRVRQELAQGVLFEDTNGSEEDQRERTELSRLLQGLLPGFADVQDSELPLITDLFSLVEYALASGDAFAIGGDDVLRRLRDLLKHAITDVLLGDFLTSWRDAPEDRMQRKVLNESVAWVQSFSPNVALISTNYDIGLEYELYKLVGHSRVPEEVDLGFDWRDTDSGTEHTRPSAPALRVYKLHGSLDVLKCAVCGYVYFNPWGAIAFQAFRRELDVNNTCVCSDGVRLQLHIVSPSLVREVRDANLLSIWRSALEWLRTAEEWFIIGYSLPPEDLAIRSLLLRAYSARPRPPRVTVVQHGEKAQPHYKVLFPKATYLSGGLERFLRDQRRGSEPRPPTA